MTFDIHELVREFDEKYGDSFSNIQRHESKVAAIPGALKPGEEVQFISEGVLASWNVRRSDVFVSTDIRFLVIRKDGKRIDEYDLSTVEEMKLEHEYYLHISFAGKVWKGFVQPSAAGLPFAYAIHASAARLRSQKGMAAPVLRLEPNSEPKAAELDPADLGSSKILAPQVSQPETDTNEEGNPDHAAPATLAERAESLGVSLTSGLRRKLTTAENVFQAGEAFVALTHGHLGGSFNEVPIVLTDQRLIFLADTPEQALSLGLGELTAVTGNKGAFAGHITLSLTDGERKIGQVPNDTIEPFINSVTAAISRDPSIDGELSATGAISARYRPTAIKNLSDDERQRAYNQLAFEMGDKSFMVKGELERLPEAMMPDELLIWMASGILENIGREQRGGGFCLMALTDRRIILLDKKLLAGVQTIAIDLDRVNTITGDTGLVLGNVKIQDGGDERKVGGINNSAIQPFVTRVQQAIQERKQALAVQQAAADSGCHSAGHSGSRSDATLAKGRHRGPAGEAGQSDGAGHPHRGGVCRAEGQVAERLDFLQIRSC